MNCRKRYLCDTAQIAEKMCGIFTSTKLDPVNGGVRSNI